MAEPAAAPKPVRFIHLKVHSAYSLLEGALPIGKIAKLAEAHGMPAIGLTDTNNMFGALEFSDKLAGSGIQPIAGVNLAVDFGDQAKPETAVAMPAPAKPRRDGLLTAFAMNEQGYANLMKLASHAHLSIPDGSDPFVSIDMIERHSAGLIILTGGPDGPIDGALRDGQRPLAEARLNRLAALAGDRLYVEVQRHGLPAESDVEPDLIALAYAHDLPLVAVNEPYFAAPEDYEAHDALLAIADGRLVTDSDRRKLSANHGFRSADEMATVFSDLPEALAATVEIAK
ncbi:MAG TPA: PHP domain-containing protein, partial [Hyphomicrobiaceae bacterium]|nr:PHP domain-containing protein [Hyphomicrobiaceae bacterium]